MLTVQPVDKKLTLDTWEYFDAVLFRPELVYGCLQVCFKLPVLDIRNTIYWCG